MKPKLTTVFSVAIAVATLFLAAEASAATVQVKVKAEAPSPFLVVKPPRPIVSPKRITMRVYHPSQPVAHVRVFGHHHRHHTIRVGHYAPRWRIRTKVVGPRVVVRDHHDHDARVRVHVGAPPPPRVEVRVNAPPPPRVQVNVGVGGHHHHHGKGKVHVGKPGGKVKIGGKFRH